LKYINEKEIDDVEKPAFGHIMTDFDENLPLIDD
jgi:hypothetical protein